MSLFPPPGNGWEDRAPSRANVAATRPRPWRRSRLGTRTHATDRRRRKIAAAPRVPSPARPHHLDLAGAMVDRGQQNSVDHLGCRVIAVGRRINRDSRHGSAMGGSKRLRLAWPSHARRVGARGYDPVRRIPAVKAQLACSACWGAGRRRPLCGNPTVLVMGCYRPLNCMKIPQSGFHCYRVCNDLHRSVRIMRARTSTLALSSFG